MFDSDNTTSNLSLKQNKKKDIYEEKNSPQNNCSSKFNSSNFNIFNYFCNNTSKSLNVSYERNLKKYYTLNLQKFDGNLL